ncbi:hypothetical protein BDV27DRAFT_158164 [Aspergillus caelatus]|uniref:DUF8213 domain-containing protein n=2 Tax=Aspergillus subgen. Circumdati TaxID=2720871 RepID=A0A5N7A3E7_9EURO|nr:uncharacterized protein BDV27DRAFT_158164 [Aspergillus caelatus]KAE8364103.1 hypothetical protein BDV27DRAFT_158164 [Aspergillus caelatus]KAE8416433.1 hypothetical protein BDV36DRAFT_297127 [Aspergillus pseudocaelatus]
MAVPSAPANNLDKRSITCLTVGESATATWTNSAGQTCTFVGVVGSNYGANSAGNGDYSCNGRCGAGCTGTALGNVYTQDCFSHDICSYFENASGVIQTAVMLTMQPLTIPREDLSLAARRRILPTRCLRRIPALFVLDKAVVFQRG